MHVSKDGGPANRASKLRCKNVRDSGVVGVIIVDGGQVVEAAVSIEWG